MPSHDRNDVCIVEIESLKDRAIDLDNKHRDILSKMEKIIETNIRLSEKVTFIVERMDKRHPRDDEHFKRLDEITADTSRMLNETIKMHGRRIDLIERSEDIRSNDKRGIVHFVITSVLGILILAIFVKLGVSKG